MKYLILVDIRSHYNVGALFRTADGAGVDKIFLAGITPAPIDRFGRKVDEIAKTALGAEEVIPWSGAKMEDLEGLLQSLKAEGFVVVAVEQDKRAISLKDWVEPESVVYVLGSETEGLAPTVLDLCDTILEIPMLGQKESLNVSVAGSIVLYHGVIAKK